MVFCILLNYNFVLYNSHNIIHCVEATWMRAINEMKGWKFKYLMKKIPPLFILEMLEGQLMIELFKVIAWCYIRWMPPRPYDFNICIYFSKCFGILIVFANFHMFCLQMWPLNKFVDVDFHRSNPMEKMFSFCWAIVGMGFLMGQTQLEQHSNSLEQYQP